MTTARHTHPLTAAAPRLAGILLLAPAAHGAGSFDVCSEPSPDSGLRTAYHHYEDVAFANGDLGRYNWDADLAFRRRDDWLVGGAYRGTFIDESDVGFRTNGYLHSFYFTLHRLRTAERNVRLAIAPALSGSSNVTKDPDQYDADAWQILFAAVWEWPAGDTLAWRAGVCADHRFGRYRAYPVAALAWRPDERWLVEAGFPEVRVGYRTGGALSAAFSLYPNGNEWYVKDKTLEFASLFEYRAWAADVSVTWTLSRSLALTVVGGVDFDAEYRGELMDGSRPTLEAGTAGRAGLEIAWAF